MKNIRNIIATAVFLLTCLPITLMAVVLALLSPDEQGRKVLDNWGRFLFEISGDEWPGIERL